MKLDSWLNGHMKDLLQFPVESLLFSESIMNCPPLPLSAFLSSLLPPECPYKLCCPHSRTFLILSTELPHPQNTSKGLRAIRWVILQQWTNSGYQFSIQVTCLGAQTKYSTKESEERKDLFCLIFQRNNSSWHGSPRTWSVEYLVNLRQKRGHKPLSACAHVAFSTSHSPRF